MPREKEENRPRPAKAAARPALRQDARPGQRGQTPAPDGMKLLREQFFSPELIQRLAERIKQL